MKKSKVVGKVPAFFSVVMVISIQKNNEYKNNINLLCVLNKKDCYRTAYIEFGEFFNNQRDNHPKNFAEIEKTKIEAGI